MATPVSVSRAGKDVNAAVHGDDFTFTVDEAALKWEDRLVNEWYEDKVRARSGLDDHDDKLPTLLGRTQRLEE